MADVKKLLTSLRLTGGKDRGPAQKPPGKEAENEDVVMATSLQPNNLFEEELFVIEAARRNDYEFLRELLESSSINVNAANKLDRTALHWAAANGQIMALDVLLRAGADPNVSDKIGMTAGLWGAWFGHAEVVRILHKRKDVKLTTVNKKGFGLLHCAAANNSIDVLDYVIATMHDVINPNLTDRHGRTALHIAAEKGHADIVELLVTFKTDVNLKDKFGCTALHLASRSGHEDICYILLNSEALPDPIDQEKRTPLHLASEAGHVMCVCAALDHGADIFKRAKKLMTSLMLAAAGGHHDVIREILYRDSSLINMKNINGNTAVHLAAQGGHVEAVRILAEYNCNKLKNELGQTSLHLAVESDNPAMVKLLLESGWSSSSKDKKGRDSLWYSMRAGYIGIVDLIIKHQRCQQLLKLQPSPQMEELNEEFYDELDEVNDVTRRQSVNSSGSDVTLKDEQDDQQSLLDESTNAEEVCYADIEIHEHPRDYTHDDSLSFHTEAVSILTSVAELQQNENQSSAHCVRGSVAEQLDARQSLKSDVELHNADNIRNTNENDNILVNEDKQFEEKEKGLQDVETPSSQQNDLSNTIIVNQETSLKEYESMEQITRDEPVNKERSLETSGPLIEQSLATINQNDKSSNQSLNLSNGVAKYHSNAKLNDTSNTSSSNTSNDAINKPSSNILDDPLNESSSDTQNYSSKKPNSKILNDSPDKFNSDLVNGPSNSPSLNTNTVDYVSDKPSSVNEPSAGLIQSQSFHRSISQISRSISSTRDDVNVHESEVFEIRNSISATEEAKLISKENLSQGNLSINDDSNQINVDIKSETVQSSYPQKRNKRTLKSLGDFIRSRATSLISHGDGKNRQNSTTSLPVRLTSNKSGNSKRNSEDFQDIEEIEKCDNESVASSVFLSTNEADIFNPAEESVCTHKDDKIEDVGVEDLDINISIKEVNEAKICYQDNIEQTDVLIAKDNVKTVISNDEIKTVIPNDDVKTVIPNDKVKTAISNDEIKTVIPSDEVKTVIPNDEIKTVIPNDKIKTVIPSDEVKTVIPSDEVKTAIYNDEIKTVIPSDEVKTVIPSDEVKTAISNDEIKTVIPSDEVKTAISNDEIKTVIPSDEVKTVIPSDEAKTVISNDKIKTIISKDEVKTVISKDDVNTMLTNDEAKTSNNEVKTVIPNDKVKIVISKDDVKTVISNDDVKTVIPNYDVKTDKFEIDKEATPTRAVESSKHTEICTDATSGNINFADSNIIHNEEIEMRDANESTEPIKTTEAGNAAPSALEIEQHVTEANVENELIKNRSQTDSETAPSTASVNKIEPTRPARKKDLLRKNIVSKEQKIPQESCTAVAYTSESEVNKALSTPYSSQQPVEKGEQPIEKEDSNVKHFTKILPSILRRKRFISAGSKSKNSRSSLASSSKVSVSSTSSLSKSEKNTSSLYLGRKHPRGYSYQSGSSVSTDINSPTTSRISISSALSVERSRSSYSRYFVHQNPSGYSYRSCSSTDSDATRTSISFGKSQNIAGNQNFTRKNPSGYSYRSCSSEGSVFTSNSSSENSRKFSSRNFTYQNPSGYSYRSCTSTDSSSTLKESPVSRNPSSRKFLHQNPSGYSYRPCSSADSTDSADSSSTLKGSPASEKSSRRNFLNQNPSGYSYRSCSSADSVYTLKESIASRKSSNFIHQNPSGYSYRSCTSADSNSTFKTSSRFSRKSVSSNFRYQNPSGYSYRSYTSTESNSTFKASSRFSRKSISSNFLYQNPSGYVYRSCSSLNSISTTGMHHDIHSLGPDKEDQLKSDQINISQISRSSSEGTIKCENYRPDYFRAFSKADVLLNEFSDPQRYPSAFDDDDADLMVDPIDRGYRYVYTDEYEKPVYSTDIAVEKVETNLVRSYSYQTCSSDSEISSVNTVLIPEETSSMSDMGSYMNRMFDTDNISEFDQKLERTSGTEYTEVAKEESVYELREPEPVDYVTLMRDVMWTLSSQYLKNEDWKTLARYWGFSSAQIHAIEHNYTGSYSDRDHCYRLLMIWLQSITTVTPDLHPMAELYTALSEIGKRKVAEKIRKKCNEKYEVKKSCRIS